MAFVIKVQKDGNPSTYWIGGDILSEYGDDAARFMSEIDACATIDILKEAIGLHQSARVVDLGEVL